jgi:thiosulfate/3-mercaptopyruvate sulfurtransferase
MNRLEDFMDSLVSTEWLAGRLGAPDLKVIDASYFLPADGRDARAEYEAEHIPGAVFMDIDAIADSSNPAPHMFPPEHEFASQMRSLGLGDGQRFVVYDNSPLHSAARGWFMLKSFGAQDVAILDGGLQKWKAEGRPLESGMPQVGQGHFTAALDGGAIADKAYVSGILHSGDHEILDARSALRFAGAEAEPRPGLEAGHIPGSRNLPQAKLFNPDNSWKQGDALRRTFDEAGVDLSTPLVTTCGSGITACVLLFGAHLLGKEDMKLYDGSWAEWGADPKTPKMDGAA